MKFTQTALPGVMLIEPDVFEDSRGFFFESYHKEKYAGAGIDVFFVQNNHSKSGKGVLRGLHYQLVQPQGKLVQVISGEIFDVVVDLRKSSPMFGKWIGMNLSARQQVLLWIPIGFAHGFYVTSENASVMYSTTDFYNPEGERSLLWNDPVVGIQWPLLNGQVPLLSPKDADGVLLAEADVFD